MSDLKTYTYQAQSSEKPKQIVFLLHGLGSNGQDLISLAPYFARALPDAVFVSPDAPFQCDMAPDMPNSFQWFSLASREQKDMERGASQAFSILNGYIDKMLQTYDLEDKDCVLSGFSQGCMMSLYTAPRREQQIAGVLGYSGALVGEGDLKNENIQKPPVYLVHGEADDVVPLDGYRHAAINLKRAGFNVDGHSTEGLGHSIDQEGLEAGTAFLTKVFA